jgi:hypothetical protein
MSIMPDDLIDLHEYEHSLLRSLMLGLPLRPAPVLPELSSFDPQERVIVEMNNRKARDLFQMYAGVKKDRTRDEWGNSIEEAPRD